MSKSRRRLGILASALLAALTAAALTVGTALAGSVGPPIPH